MSLMSANSLIRFSRIVFESSLNVPVRAISVKSKWYNLNNVRLSSTEVKTDTVRGDDLKDNEPVTKSSKNSEKAEIDKLNEAISLLTEKKDMFEDKYKRALAEGENLRSRLTKQIEDAKLFGIQGFCKDLLEVADILTRATESVPKEEVSEKNPHLKSLYEGLIMTEAQLQKVFKRHGLVAVNPLNEKFDPNLHEALFQQEVQGSTPGTVVVVSKIGYKLHERCIRPALVGVAKAP